MNRDRLLTLAFLALAAFVSARSASEVAAHLIDPLPVPPVGPRGAVAAQKVPTRARLDVSALARLTGLPVPVVTSEPAVVEPRFDENAAPVKTSLRLQLLGTLVASQAAYSMASVLALDARDTSTLMVGDTVLGAEVLEIERERVLLLNQGRREFLETGGAPPPLAAARTAAPATAQARRPTGNKEPPLGAGIRATSANDYEVPKSEVDRALGNLNQLAMKARIVPAFKNGQSIGFKLFSIRPDSLYAKIGIQNGDVIKRINGYDLNSPEKALEVYMKLKEARRIDLELERGGATVRKTYSIR